MPSSLACSLAHRRSRRARPGPAAAASAILTLIMAGSACTPAQEPDARPRPADPGARPGGPAAGPDDPAARPRGPAARPADPGARPGPRAPSAALVASWRAASWAEERGDAAGTGATTAAPVRKAPRVLWRYDVVGGAVTRPTGAPRPRPAGPAVAASPAVVGGGRVFFGSSAGRIFAVDVATGARLWSHDVKDEILASPAWQPGPGGGTVFAGLASSGALVAWDARRGSRRFSVLLGSPALAAPLAAGGRIFIGTGAPSLRYAEVRGALHAVDVSTGKPIWRRTTLTRHLRTVKRRLFLGGLTAKPALSSDGLLYVTDQAGWLHAVEQRTGRSRQKESIDRRASYTPATAGTRAFFHRGGSLHYLGQPGRILGFFARPSKPLGEGLGSPALAPARLFIAGEDALVATKRLPAASPRPVSPLWRYALPRQTEASRHSAPVVAGAGTPEETVYLVDAAGTLHAVDAATGKALWTRSVARPTANPNPLRAPAAPAPALLPHLIVVSTPQGDVLALTDG